MIEINGLSNVVIHAVGLGDQNARFPFYGPPADNLGVGSFVKEFTDENRYVGELQIVRGDDWLTQFGRPHFELIKMDIEGYEKQALQGLQDTVHQSRPVIVLETTLGSSSGFRSEQELALVLPAGYFYLEILHFRVLADRRQSGYQLVEYKDGIGRPVNLILFPEELSSRIPISNLPPR